MIPVPAAVLGDFCAQLGIQPADLTLLGGGREDSDGIVYRIPGEKVLKILPYEDQDDLACVRERAAFAAFLAERGVHILLPLPGPAGDTILLNRASHDQFAAYCTPFMPGKLADLDSLSPAVIQAWGASLGRLHRVSTTYPHWRGSQAVDGAGVPLISWERERDRFLSWCREPRVGEKWIDLNHRLGALPIERDSFGFTHNDPHEQNILVDGESVCFIDFDVANAIWFASDIAIAMQGTCFAKSGGLERPVSDPGALQRFLETFLGGYMREFTLAEEWRQRLNLFIAYRRMLLFIILQDFLAHRPETRASWLEMILEEPDVLKF